MLTSKLKSDILLFLLLFSIILGTAIFNIISVIFIIIVMISLIKNSDFHYLKQKWFLLSTFLFIIFFISSLFSEYIDLIFFKNLSNFRFVFLALSVQYHLQKNNNQNLFLYIITFLTLFVSFDSFIQYALGTNLFGNNLNQENLQRIRLTSIFGNEEIVGAFLVKFIAIGTIGSYFFFRKSKFISIVYFTVISLTILFSQERMAFLLALLLLFMIIIFNLFKKNYNFFLILSILSILILFLSFYFNNSLALRYLSTFTNGAGLAKSEHDDNAPIKNSIKSIYEINEVEISFKDSHWGAHFLTAIEIFKNNTFIGIGARSFRYECGKDIYGDINSHYIYKRCSTHPHNYYLEILSENGIIGFTYFLFLLVMFYIKEIKFFYKNKNLIQLFALLGLFINLWPIASTGSFYSSFNSLIIWINVGFIFSISSKQIKFS